MLNSPSSTSSRTQYSWAELRVRDRVTRYLRRGVGQPVLLLRAAEETLLWASLADALSARYRVILPELGEHDREDSSRIIDFLEGLGCSNVIVIADAEFARASLELATAGSDQIARVVIVGLPADFCFTAPRASSAIPVLTVDTDHNVAELLSIIAELLTDPR